MQGRLLNKYQGRYQAHPLGYWKDEFKSAQEIGLDCIEFIFDYNDSEKNPLLTKDGLDQISLISENTGVDVLTICADYFMEAPLHSSDLSISEQSYKILIRLLNSAYQLGVTDIVLPCVDQSSLNCKQAIDRFVEKLYPVVEIAEKNKINVSLETDLAPEDFGALLDRFDSSRVTVNYDIGNSASLGFNPVEELDIYGERITDIHIKDRILGAGSVELGKGDANFSSFFKKLKEFDYKGPFIMQAYRDEEGIEIFKKQLAWVQPYLGKTYE